MNIKAKLKRSKYYSVWSIPMTVTFLRFTCGSCGNKLKARVVDIGKRAHCSCGHRFVVPGFEVPMPNPDKNEPKTAKSTVVIVSPSVFEQEEFPEEVSEELPVK